jgi:hypothetical protein
MEIRMISAAGLPGIMAVNASDEGADGGVRIAD